MASGILSGLVLRVYTHMRLELFFSTLRYDVEKNVELGTSAIFLVCRHEFASFCLLCREGDGIAHKLNPAAFVVGGTYNTELVDGLFDHPYDAVFANDI